jgi:hypothetical protein
MAFCYFSMPISLSDLNEDLISNPFVKIIWILLMHSQVRVDTSRSTKAFSAIFAQTVCGLPEVIIVLLKSLEE